jgi:murein DD-endopeptidase MepM/ murein hydrolase activator NlpD
MGQTRTRSGPSHRLPAPPPALRSRIVLAAVAAGAVAAGSTLNTSASGDQPSDDSVTPLAWSGQAEGLIGIGGGATAEDLTRPQVLAFVREEPSQVRSITKAQQISTERAAREAERAARAAAAARAAEQAQRAARQAARPAQPARPAAQPARPPQQVQARRAMYVLPAVGRLTSGYGARWGSMHWGIDIANKIGTPILAAADGVVVESGPASGFGLWVRIRHGDGTITVYGHIDRSLVREGQSVRAGQQIATMGNRGQSTGPHLHFEVWNPGGAKVNPLTWLRSHGVRI